MAHVVVDFQRSSCCGASSCIEVGFDGDTVLIRDSATGRTLDFTREEWHAFRRGIQAGEFRFEPPPA